MRPKQRHKQIAELTSLLHHRMMDEQLELNATDPMDLFGRWMGEAETSELNDPVAAALATSTLDGRPSVRMVLVKGHDASGFSFFTNAESRKGRELQSNPRAALCFHWKSLRRQVRAEGPVTSLSSEVSDRYFHSRSRGSQIAAAVSAQSRPLASRDELEHAVSEFTASLDGGEVSRPEYWKGYLLRPVAIEFWIDGKDRLHDRLLFTETGAGWSRQRLYP